MAENIVTGRKYRILTDAAQQLWDRVSFWSKASDTEANDGKDLETKVGAINGITSDVNGEAEDVAASIKVVHDLNTSLGGLSFAQDDNGNWGYKIGGADAVTPFSIKSVTASQSTSFVPTKNVTKDYTVSGATRILGIYVYNVQYPDDYVSLWVGGSTVINHNPNSPVINYVKGDIINITTTTTNYSYRCRVYYD